MRITDAVIDIFIGDAEADNRRLAEIGLIFIGINEVLKDIAVQFAKISRNGEGRLLFIMIRQKNAEIVIPDIRGEVIPDDPFYALVGFFINDVGF